MIPSPVNWATVPPYRCTTVAQRSASSARISRNRSAPTAAAMSIEWTTSANSTVTCLYSADRLSCVTGAPHSLQNLEFGGSSVPHDPQSSPVAVSPPPPSPLGSTSVSFHCWSEMSGISTCHLRDEVSRLSVLVYFETPAVVFGPTVVLSLPRPTPYAPRSPAMSPLRGSGPDSRGRRLHPHGRRPAAPAAAAARCRVSPDPHRLARPPTARSRPRLRPHHRQSRDPAGSPPEHPHCPAADPRGIDRRRPRDARW